LLQLQVYKAKIKVSGIGANVPDSVVIDVSEEELYASIKAIGEELVEQPEEVKPAL